MQRSDHPPVRLPELPQLRVGTMLVKDLSPADGCQLPLLPHAPATPRPLPVLDSRLRGTRFVAHSVRSVLNSPAQTGMDFWSLNPYVGCEFGCTYCYARFAHRYAVERAHDQGRLTDEEFADYRGTEGWEAFENRIFVKDHLLETLEKDLRKFCRVALPPAKAEPDTIVIGTATDPYQPAERIFRITRSVLERLAQCEGLSVGIITKSPLVARDADLLVRLSQRNDLEVYVSLITTDDYIIHALEARSPVPRARLRGLKALTDAGVRAGLIVAPVLPGITDDIPHLEALFAAAREAGARFIHASPLRMYPGIRDRFLPVLAEHFPELSEKYRTAYARAANAPRESSEALNRRIQRLQKAYGLEVNNGMRNQYRSRSRIAQLDLKVPEVSRA